MAYAAAQGGSLPVRSPQVRPIRVADLLSREGHPLAAQVITGRDRLDPADLDALLEQKFVTLDKTGQACPRLTHRGHSLLKAVGRTG